MRFCIVPSQRHQWERITMNKISYFILHCHTTEDTNALKYWSHESAYGRHLSQELDNIPAKLKLKLQWNPRDKEAHIWVGDNGSMTVSNIKKDCTASFGFDPPSYVKCYDADSMEVHLNFQNSEIEFKNSTALVRLDDGSFKFSGMNGHMQSDVTDYLLKETRGEVKVTVHVSFPDPGSLHATRLLQELNDFYKSKMCNTENSDLTLKTKDHAEIKCHKAFVDVPDTIKSTYTIQLNKDAAQSYVKYQYYRNLELSPDNPSVSVELLEFAQLTKNRDLESDVCLSLRESEFSQLCDDDLIKLFGCLAKVESVSGRSGRHHAIFVETLKMRVWKVINSRPKEIQGVILNRCTDSTFLKAYLSVTWNKDANDEFSPKRLKLSTGSNDLDDLPRSSDHFSVPPSGSQHHPGSSDPHSTTATGSAE